MAEQPHDTQDRESDAAQGHALPREAEEASRALVEVQELLRRHRLAVEVAHRQHYGEQENRHELVEHAGRAAGA